MVVNSISPFPSPSPSSFSVFFRNSFISTYLSFLLFNFIFVSVFLLLLFDACTKLYSSSCYSECGFTQSCIFSLISGKHSINLFSNINFLYSLEEQQNSLEAFQSLFHVSLISVLQRGPCLLCFQFMNSVLNSVLC